MKLFKKFLVVINSQTDNQDLSYHAVDLAQRNQAALLVVDVVEVAPPDIGKPILRDLAGKAQEPEIEIIEETTLWNSYSTCVKETLFGNTTMHLMRKCPCPVWVIKPGQSKPLGRILAAVDLVQGDKDRTALNQKISNWLLRWRDMGKANC